MKREDDQQLWDLLGRAKTPELSPFFARNVLREIRTSQDSQSRWRGWLSWRRLAPATAAAAAALALAAIAIFQADRAEETDLAAADMEVEDYYALLDYVDMLEAEEEEYHLL